jgi:hypothetical protein
VQRLPGADRSGPAARRADAQCRHPLRLPRSGADGREQHLAFTSRYFKDQRITIPVAHHDGNFFADDATLDRIEGEGRVAFRYAEEVNGSARNIAGVLNEKGNVLGMMPHPERFIEAAQGGIDGRACSSVVRRWFRPDRFADEMPTGRGDERSARPFFLAGGASRAPNRSAPHPRCAPP